MRKSRTWIGDTSCKLCGAALGNLDHMYWECPKLKQARYAKDPDLEQLNWKLLPANLRLGIPGIIPAADTCCLWHDDHMSLADVAGLPAFARLDTPMCPSARNALGTLPRTANRYNAHQVIQAFRHKNGAIFFKPS